MADVSTLALAICLTSAGIFAIGLVVPPALRTRISPKAGTPRPFGPTSPPSIEVVVPAYLEAGLIGAKVRDLRLALERYEGSGTITVMASDESTVLAAREAGADKPVSCGRRGKAAAINEAIAESASDVVVLTDANCTISPVTWPNITVSRLEQFDLVSANKEEGNSVEGMYWQLEKWIKGKESEPTSTLSVVGEFLAFRREDFRPIPELTMADDLFMALDFTRRGLDCAVESAVVTHEEPASRRDQWDRRVRICEGLIRESLPHLDALWRTPVGRMFLAHKVFRMTVGCAAFWTATLALGLVYVPVTLPFVLIVIGIALGWYVGRIRLSLPGEGVWAAIAMQAVPVATAWQVAVRKLRRLDRSAGWKKIAR